MLLDGSDETAILHCVSWRIDGTATKQCFRQAGLKVQVMTFVRHNLFTVRLKVTRPLIICQKLWLVLFAVSPSILPIETGHYELVNAAVDTQRILVCHQVEMTDPKRTLPLANTVMKLR